jgi:uncharacterized protein YdaL
MVTRPDISLRLRRHHRRRFWTVLSWVLALALSGALVLGASLRTLSGHEDAATLPPLRTYHGCSTGAPAAPASGPATLVVLSDGEPMSRMYGTLARNLISHFGGSQVITASDYKSGMAAGYRGIVYIGASTGTPVPSSFLYDVLNSGRQVLWLGENISQLANFFAFQSTYGWTPGPDQKVKIRQIRYRNTALARDPGDTDPLTAITSVSGAKVLGTVVTADGRTLPWAVRSGHLTYVAEVPLDASTQNDRYLAVADMLYDLLSPRTTARHRALVRLEDIGPEADPKAVKAAGELLIHKHIPFSFGVFPIYIGPTSQGPHRKKIRMRDRPELVQVISYFLRHGGTMVLHGYTHQSVMPANPDSGESGQDFEFFRTHYDSHHALIYDGPLPGDSATWAEQRFDASAAELRAAHLPVPRIIEFPHYAASKTDYQQAAVRFAARYDHGQYFAPDWNGRSPASPYMYEQFAPYVIRDVYGSTVVPENLGFVQRVPEPDDIETVGTIVTNARSELVVRDNVASFFFHPFLGTKPLEQAVDQIKDMGYHFVSPCDL